MSIAAPETPQVAPTLCAAAEAFGASEIRKVLGLRGGVTHHELLPVNIKDCVNPVGVGKCGTRDNSRP